MKPYAIGKTVYLREVSVNDADFIFRLRSDKNKSKYLSEISNQLIDQINFIENYKKSIVDYYFIISDHNSNNLGTVRIYDIKDDSFCWGSWIIVDGTASTVGIESALLIYDFAFYSLHFKKSHFDVRKSNLSVINFHKRFGAKIISEDNENFYFSYSLEDYKIAINKFLKFIP